jgi:hypothetical protein
MPINWNLAGYVNPDIKITPNEVPLEAMLNVGDKLQKDYDMSYENYTKAQEALRQMVNAAHLKDKPAAEKIFSRFEPELKKIAESGRFHDMKWQTQKLANQAANDYLSVATKNKTIQANLDAIAKDPKWRFTTANRQKAYLNSIPELAYDNERGILTGLDVQAYAGAADVNRTELAAKAASLMKPKDFGYNDGKLVFFDAEGKETSNPMESVRTVHRVDGKKDQILTPEQIRSAVGKYMMADEGVNAEIERNIQEGEVELTGDPEKDAIIKQQYRESLINPALDAAGELFKIDNSFRNFDETESQGMAYASWAAGATPEEGYTYEPTSINVDANKFKGKELSTVFQDAVKGDVSSKIAMFGILESEIEKLKKNGNVEKARLLDVKLDKVKNVLEFVDKYPQYKNILTVGKFVVGGSDEDPTKIGALLGEVKKNQSISKEDKEKLFSSFEKNNVKFDISSPHLTDIGSYFDSELEDLFQNAESTYFRNIPIQAPDASNAKLRNALQGLDLSIDYFKIDPENLPDGVRPTDKVKIEGYTTEPIGGGVDYLFRLRDEKGNVYTTEASKATGRSILNQVTKYSNTEIGSKSEFKSFPATVERPTRFVDLVKAGKGRYYDFSNDKENKKPMWALEPTDEIRPNDVGGVRTYSIYRNGSLYPFPDNQGKVKTEFQSIFDIYKAAKFN